MSLFAAKMPIYKHRAHSAFMGAKSLILAVSFVCLHIFLGFNIAVSACFFSPQWMKLNRGCARDVIR